MSLRIYCRVIDMPHVLRHQIVVGFLWSVIGLNDYRMPFLLSLLHRRVRALKSFWVTIHLLSLSFLLLHFSKDSLFLILLASNYSNQGFEILSTFLDPLLCGLVCSFFSLFLNHFKCFKLSGLSVVKINGWRRCFAWVQFCRFFRSCYAFLMVLQNLIQVW